jgi:cytoskeletal protein CcmA (bactofilin family)
MFQKPSPQIALPDNQEYMQDDIETVVGPSVHVEGDFASEGNILVKGMVSGNVKTSRLLTVEEGAVIKANVHAGDALISGDIAGDVQVDDKLELTSTARILGNITCRVLAIDAGALVQGTIHMEGIDLMEDEAPARRATRKRRSKAAPVEDTMPMEEDAEMELLDEEDDDML